MATDTAASLLSTSTAETRATADPRWYNVLTKEEVMTDQELEAGRQVEQAFQDSYAAWRAVGRPLVGPELDAALNALAAWDAQSKEVKRATGWPPAT